MTRLMYDAINSKVGLIPIDAEMVAGYVDGLFQWSAADWARFPRAVPVEIAVFATTNAGKVLDVEQGNATPAQAPGWAVMRRKAGCDPSVYCSLSNWPTLKAAFTSAGVPEPHWWVAYYDGSQTIPAGAVAHQYTDNPPGSPYDTSVVADLWPGVDCPMEEDMRIMNDGKTQWLVFGGVKVAIGEATELVAISESGIPSVGAAVPAFLAGVPVADQAKAGPLSIALSGTVTPS